MAAKVKNLVQKLSLRQVRGCLKPALRGASSIKLFDTVYSRGCYIKLDNILDKEGEIKNGHVLLGFTKDGRFLISYTLVIDYNFYSDAPRYFYTLHWWKFDYNRPLVKVHSVPLFKSIGSDQDLHIIISESLDQEQFIVWGRSAPDPNEQSCQCHVTICPALPTKPCLGCKELGDVKCIRHCYVIDFLYHSLPPYPTFLPSVSLQIPGTILLNCGDHLVALTCVPCGVYSQVEKALKHFKVRPTVPPDMTSEDFESVQRCRRSNAWLDKLHIGNEGTDSDGESCDSSSKNSECLLQGLTTLKKDNSDFVASNEVSLSQMGDCYIPSGSVSDENKQIGNTRNDETVPIPFLRNSASDGNVTSYNISNSPKDVTDDNDNGVKDDDVRNNNENNNLNVSNSDDTNVKNASYDTENHDDDDHCFQKHCSNYDTSNKDDEKDGRAHIGDASDDHDNDGNDDNGVRSSNDTNNNKNPTKFTFRTFCYTETFIREDDTDTDLHELIFDIFCNGEPVNSCSNVYRMTEPSILICQAFFSIEECINELLQSHHELRDRYKSLRDYDCQFMSACPETGDVIIMVKVLISAKRTRNRSSQGLPVSPNPSLYQTGFILAWNIWSGHYRTLHYMDITDYTPSKQSTKSVSSIEASRNLRKEAAIPTSYQSQVRVFSNHTVFTSQSLKYLVHPFLPIVLVM